MDTDGIDLAVLYPTMLLGLQSITDVDVRAACRRTRTTTGRRTTPRRARAGCSGRARCPPMHDADDVQGVADEIRRVAEMPGMVSVFMRPNPAVDWRHFNDPVYDPIWQAAADTGLADRVPPVPHARPPGRVPRA